MKNIHLLPTNKPSRLYYNVGGALLFTSYENHNGVNIYITNDEEIKEVDWIICSMSVAPTKALKNEDYLFSNAWRKIILTTDKELINNGVQAIDDEFLEWFIKNPTCENVETKWYSRYNGYNEQILTHYKVIIPQEESKQKTFEEVFENYSKKSKGFIAGVKWQAKRIYKEFRKYVTSALLHWALDVCPAGDFKNRFAIFLHMNIEKL